MTEATIENVDVFMGNIFSTFRIIVNVRNMRETQPELSRLLDTFEDGEVVIVNSVGEKYLVTQKNDGRVSLSLVEGDYTGDPTVVANFNKIAETFS